MKLVNKQLNKKYKLRVKKQINYFKTYNQMNNNLSIRLSVLNNNYKKLNLSQIKHKKLINKVNNKNNNLKWIKMMKISLIIWMKMIMRIMKKKQKK